MATHLTVRVMTELPGKTAAEKEAWLDKVYDPHTHQWQQAEDKLRHRSRVYQQTVERVLASFDEGERRLLDVPNTLLIVTPQQLDKFTGDKNDASKAGISYQNKNFRILIFCRSEDTMLPKFLQHRMLNFGADVAHELTHTLYYGTDFKKKMPELQALARRVRERARIIAPEEIAAIEEGLHTYKEHPRKWHNLDFLGLSKKKELAILTWIVCNPEYYKAQDYFYKAKDYKPEEHYEEAACNLAGLSYQFGRDKVRVLAGDFMDYVAALQNPSIGQRRASAALKK